MRILDRQRYWAFLKAYAICFVALVGLYVVMRNSFAVRDDARKYLLTVMRDSLITAGISFRGDADVLPDFDAFAPVETGLRDRIGQLLAAPADELRALMDEILSQVLDSTLTKNSFISSALATFIDTANKL